MRALPLLVAKRIVKGNERIFHARVVNRHLLGVEHSENFGCDVHANPWNMVFPGCWYDLINPGCEWNVVVGKVKKGLPQFVHKLCRVPLDTLHTAELWNRQELEPIGCSELEGGRFQAFLDAHHRILAFLSAPFAIDRGEIPARFCNRFFSLPLDLGVFQFIGSLLNHRPSTHAWKPRFVVLLAIFSAERGG